MIWAIVATFIAAAPQGGRDAGDVILAGVVSAHATQAACEAAVSDLRAYMDPRQDMILAADCIKLPEDAARRMGFTAAGMQ